MDVSALALTRAGTARHIRSLLAALERRGRGRSPLRARRLVARARAGARPRLVPGGAAGEGAAGRRGRPALPDPARAGALARAAGRHLPRPRRAAAPGDLQPLDADLLARPVAARRAGGEPVDRGLRVHQARAASTCSTSRREGARDPERGRPAVLRRRRGGGRRLRARGLDARAAQEPAAPRRGLPARRPERPAAAGRRREPAGAACGSRATAFAGSAR